MDINDGQLKYRGDSLLHWCIEYVFPIVHVYVPYMHCMFLLCGYVSYRSPSEGARLDEVKRKP